MAEIIWTHAALDELKEIAEYIAFENPQAASRLVRNIVSQLDRLRLFPDSGHEPAELPGSIYREVYVRPCRVFYRKEGSTVFIVHVMREERQLRLYLFEND